MVGAAVATQCIDNVTIALAVGAILLGGVAASIVGTYLANRHDRRERFRERRIDACGDFLQAIARARVALRGADLQAGVTAFMRMLNPPGVPRAMAETFRLTDVGATAVEDATLQKARILLVFPDDALVESAQALIDAAQKVVTTVRGEFLESTKAAERRAEDTAPAESSSSFKPALTLPSFPPPIAKKEAFEGMAAAEAAFEAAARLAIHPMRRRKFRW